MSHSSERKPSVRLGRAHILLTRLLPGEIAVVFFHVVRHGGQVVCVCGLVWMDPLALRATRGSCQRMSSSRFAVLLEPFGRRRVYRRESISNFHQARSEKTVIAALSPLRSHFARWR